MSSMSIPGATHDHLERVLFDEATILARLDEIAARITRDYADRPLTVVAVPAARRVMLSASSAALRAAEAISSTASPIPRLSIALDFFLFSAILGAYRTTI